VKTIPDLNELDAEAFGASVAPLFEGAPGFLAALAEARPFESDEALFEAARATARSMPLDGQIELLNAHPRIGADPASVSKLSHAEQGFDGDDPDDQAWVDDELRALNEAYEARFGFRFVVFVAGRPRADILPLLERAVTADRDEELRRGLDDVILIAADRMGAMRGPAPLREEQREAIALEVSRHLVGELDVDGLVRATHRLIEGGIESPALLALSLAEREEPGVSEAIGSLMREIGLEGWGTRQSGQLLALHAAASILGEVSQPIDGARRIVAVTDHPGLRELIARWEAAPDQRDAIDVLITREASDLFEEGAATS
jgi:2-oxo-4-hydroxy-4-carboxy--5-ureidoimidazoline (OHCU) decarboxylase